MRRLTEGETISERKKTKVKGVTHIHRILNPVKMSCMVYYTSCKIGLARAIPQAVATSFHKVVTKKIDEETLRNL